MSTLENAGEPSADAPARLWWLPFLILLVAHLPLVLIDLSNTWQRAHYQFFPFAFIAFFALLSSRQHSHNPHPRLILCLVVIDMVMLLAAAAVRSPWLASVGLWLLLLAVAVSRKDKDTGSSLAYLALLPLLAVRLPANSDLLVIQTLQDLTSRVASKVLDLVGCLHVRDGNVITLTSKTLLVEEACSGVQSLFTLLFLAVLICCCNRRRPFHFVLVVGAAVFFAGCMNVCRVITIALAEDSWQIDLTTGWSHDALGYAVLGIAAGLVYNFDLFMLGFTERVPDEDLDAPNVEFRNPCIAVFNCLISTRTWHTPRGLEPTQPAHKYPFRRSVIISSVLCGLGIAAQAPAFLHSPERSIVFETNLALLNESNLDPKIAGYVRQSYDEEERSKDDVAGQYTNGWVFRNENVAARVSCDHLFCGWHDLRTCYTGNGWQVLETKMDKTNTAWPAIQARLGKNRNGSHAILFFSLFDSTGVPTQPPNSIEGLMQYKLILGASPPDTLQCQTFAVLPVPFSSDQIDSLRQLHLETRQQIRDAALQKVVDEKLP
ncbi:MAG: exosortase U [Fuerstiella sp.]|nr:exosortase U [Fuerstiella sp.]